MNATQAATKKPGRNYVGATSLLAVCSGALNTAAYSLYVNG